MAKRKTSSKAGSRQPQPVGDSDLNTLLQATVIDGFDETDWNPPVSLPQPGPMDTFRLELIDQAPHTLATGGAGWASRSKAASVARAIARADPAVTLRTYRGHDLPRRGAGRYETFIRPTGNDSWHIAARHNPHGTWPGKRKTGDTPASDRQEPTP